MNLFMFIVKLIFRSNKIICEWFDKLFLTEMLQKKSTVNVLIKATVIITVNVILITIMMMLIIIFYFYVI